MNATNTAYLRQRNVLACVDKMLDTLGTAFVTSSGERRSKAAQSDGDVLAKNPRYGGLDDDDFAEAWKKELMRFFLLDFDRSSATSAETFRRLTRGTTGPPSSILVEFET